MNARILLNFRVSTLCRLLAVGSLLGSFSLVGCGTAAAGSDAQSVTGDDGANGDTGVTDDGRDDGDGGDTIDHTDDILADGHTDADVPKDVSDTVSNPDGTGDADGISGGDADVKPDTGPALPICPEAKGSCKLCTLCPAFPICTLKALGKPELQTYPNDCAAICALGAVNGLAKDTNGQFWQGECPACPLCAPTDLKLKDPWCVTLKSGAKVTVDHKCEVGCVADAAMKADGVTVNANYGACKAKCTDPVASGGAGCASKGQPICAKEDNSTYTNQCKMENCDVSGCFPIGATAKTSTCAPGAMTKECDGACYDAAKTPQCTAECSPVCGIRHDPLPAGGEKLTGISYRSSCIAAADKAKVGDCTNISATASDPCAAGLLYKAKGCCPDVEYSIINPVCGSQTVAGKPDQFVTFQNQGEFDCLTKGDPSWLFQYVGPCICNCNNAAQPVCGADGFTYQNACQADCYNPPVGSFQYTNGQCP